MAASPDIISGLLSDPNTAPYLGAAMGLLGSSGASRLPVTMGAAMGNALGGSQQYNQQVLQNAMARLQLGYKDWLLSQMGAQPGSPSQSLSNLNQGQSPAATPAANQLRDLSQASSGSPSPDPASANLLLSPNASSALRMPVPGVNAENAETEAPAAGVPQQPQQGGLFPGMNPSERLTMLSGLFTDPGRLASTMYANNPMVKGAESALAIDQMMMQQAARNNDADSYQLWQQKAYEDSGSMQHTFGGVANVLGMGPGGSLVFGKPPEATIMRNGQVQLAPGSLNAITSTEMAHRFVPYVNPVTGATTGYTSAFNASGPQARPANTTASGVAPPSGAPVLSIGPAQTAGQTALAKEATEEMTEAIGAQQPAQTQIAQLGDLEANLDALNTSAAKPASLWLEKWMNGATKTFGIPAFEGDVTNSQAAQKTIINFTQSSVRALGAREPYQAIEFVRQSLPAIQNTPQANQVVTGMLRGLAEYLNYRGRAANDWSAKYGNGYVPGRGTFNSQWQAHADPLAYMMESLPPFEQQMMLKSAQKNATLRYELQRAARSKDWLVQNGYFLSSESEK